LTHLVLSIFLGGENSWANRLAQQASGYVVSQGVLWVASVSSIQHRYALRSKVKPMLENSDRIQELGQGCEIRLQEEAKPTSVERLKEDSVMKKDKVEKDGSPLDEGRTKPIMEGDSVKGGDAIRTDWRLPLLEYIRDPEKTIDKKIKQQALKYMSLDDDLYQRTIDDVLLKCLGKEQTKVVVREVHDGICGVHQSAHKTNWLL
jgi:hypothetical protein